MKSKFELQYRRERNILIKAALVILPLGWILIKLLA